MSEDKTALTTKEDKKVKKAKKGDKKSIIWIIGVVILILISATFILPTTMFSSTQNAVSFGKYKGKSIDLTANSYFYYQLQSIYSYYVQNYGEQNASSASYNIYYTAFQQALVNEEFQAMATKAGFKATSNQVYDAIINSGYYSDGTNTFSQEVYNQATDMQKEQIVSWMKAYVPFEEVEKTILSAPLSKAESEFITSLSNDRRTIEYLPVTGLTYPDEDAVEYAKAREELFKVMSFTRATYQTEEEAQNAMTAIANGTKTMEEAVSESIDSSASLEGKVENAYRYMIDNYLSSTAPDGAEKIFSAEDGSLVGPIHTPEGYTLFYVDKASADPDLTDETALSVVKSYITTNDSEVMKAYLEGLSATIYEEAKNDFEATAEKYNLTIGKVNSVAENTGDSQYIYSFNWTSESSSLTGTTTNGYVYTAALADKSFNEKLFSADYGTVFEPVYANNAYIICRPVEATTGDNYSATLLSTLYNTYAPQNSLIDYESSIVTSDNVEDNFFNGYLQAAFGYGSSSQN